MISQTGQPPLGCLRLTRIEVCDGGMQPGRAREIHHVRPLSVVQDGVLDSHIEKPASR
jgi:hypothetical protein